MIAVLLRLIPPEWRESVERDLAEENARAGRSTWRAQAWIAWQVLRIAVRFRWHVLRRTVVICLIGLVGGVLVYAWTSQYVVSRLYEVRPLDPLTLVSAAAVLMIAALSASWLPARRATSVDPAITLSAE